MFITNSTRTDSSCFSDTPLLAAGFFISVAEKPGAELRFGAAVNVDHHGPLSRKSSRRPIEKSRNQFSIEALPANQLRLYEILNVQSTRFTIGPAFQLSSLNVEGECVSLQPSGAQGEAQIPSVSVPFYSSNNAEG